jgi:hypothetical protein
MMVQVISFWFVSSWPLEALGSEDLSILCLVVVLYSTIMIFRDHDTVTTVSFFYLKCMSLRVDDI